VPPVGVILTVPLLPLKQLTLSVVTFAIKAFGSVIDMLTKSEQPNASVICNT